MVPEGVSNLADGKEVTSSDDFPIIGGLDYVTDGDKESEEGYFVELAPGTQWIQIDLESSSTIYGVAIWHFHTQKRRLPRCDRADFRRRVFRKRRGYDFQ